MIMSKCLTTILFNQRAEIKFMFKHFINNFVYILRPKKIWMGRIDRAGRKYLRW